VKHFASSRFWRSYRSLPKDIQQLADRCYDLLKSSPTHRSLHFKKVGQYWSARVGLHYRALAVESGTDLVWFWIGSHADYDRLVGKVPANRPPQPTGRAQSKARLRKRQRAPRG
jgi:hypothetical protein